MPANSKLCRGRFEVIPSFSFAQSTFDKPERPYEFHTVVRQALASIRVEAERRNQEIIIDLDQVRSINILQPPIANF